MCLIIDLASSPLLDIYCSKLSKTGVTLKIKYQYSFIVMYAQT